MPQRPDGEAPAGQSAANRAHERPRRERVVIIGARMGGAHVVAGVQKPAQERSFLGSRLHVEAFVVVNHKSVHWLPQATGLNGNLIIGPEVEA